MGLLGKAVKAVKKSVGFQADLLKGGFGKTGKKLLGNPKVQLVGAAVADLAGCGGVCSAALLAAGGLKNGKLTAKGAKMLAQAKKLELDAAQAKASLQASTSSPTGATPWLLVGGGVLVLVLAASMRKAA